MRLCANISVKVISMVLMKCTVFIQKCRQPWKAHISQTGWFSGYHQTQIRRVISFQPSNPKILSLKSNTQGQATRVLLSLYGNTTLYYLWFIISTYIFEESQYIIWLIVWENKKGDLQKTENSRRQNFHIFDKKISVFIILGQKIAIKLCFSPKYYVLSNHGYGINRKCWFWVS